jgi:imidazolonepropionase-like amidohydrolase
VPRGQDVPHAVAHHLKAEVVDASNLTVMPGLMEFHSHLQKDYGAAQGRAWLAFRNTVFGIDSAAGSTI